MCQIDFGAFGESVDTPETLNACRSAPKRENCALAAAKQITAKDRTAVEVNYRSTRVSGFVVRLRSRLQQLSGVLHSIDNEFHRRSAPR